MEIFDFIFHIDEYLAKIIEIFGLWTYVILFGVIFAETGLIVTPFLPGDSLLFAIGALAGGGFLQIGLVYFLLLTATLLGDNVNYWAGHFIGEKVFTKENSRIFNRAYLEKTRSFYAKHGGKTVILARFLPIVRTFAPFVAGIGKMTYRTFLFYSVLGAFSWVSSMLFAGYFFGGLPFVKKNFELVVVAIILLSISPMIIEYIKHKKGPKVDQKKLANLTLESVEKTFQKDS